MDGHIDTALFRGIGLCGALPAGRSAIKVILVEVPRTACAAWTAAGG
jgi:hypothetical protein